GVATTTGIDRREVLAELGVPELELAPAPREDLGVPRVPRREHAVEEVDALGAREEEVVRRPDAHEVARAVLGEERARVVEDLAHLLGALAHGEAADRVSRKVEGAERLRALLAEVEERAPLDDPEEPLLVLALVGFERAERPGRRASDRGGRLLPGA